MRQLLVDLRDTVWRLRREREELLGALGEARQDLEMRRTQDAELKAVRDELVAKEKVVVELVERVRKLEKQRCMLGYVVAGCVAVVVMFWSWM